MTRNDCNCTREDTTTPMATLNSPKSLPTRSPNQATDYLIYFALMMFQFALRTAMHTTRDPDCTGQADAIGGLMETGLATRFAADVFDEYSDGRPVMSVIEVDVRTAHVHLWSPTPTPGEREVVRGALVSAPGAPRAGYFVVFADESIAELRIETHPPTVLPIGPDGRGL